MKLHSDEVDIDETVVARLVAEQVPQLQDLPIREVRSTGTVNAIYRIGDAVYARLPRVGTYAESLEREWEWLPRLAPHLPLRVPKPVQLGRPDAGYPFAWAVFDWIEGQPYDGRDGRDAEPHDGRDGRDAEPHDGRDGRDAGTYDGRDGQDAETYDRRDGRVGDEREAARSLATFVSALRAVSAADAPPAGRPPLRDLDAGTRDTLRSAPHDVNVPAALSVWEDAVQAPAWTGNPVWIHADLLRPNLLVRAGRLEAVLDFGSAGAGDPATDVIAAWAVFGREGREEYRRCLDVDDDTWRRARGIALSQAAAIIPYYRDSNPAFVSLAKRTVDQIIDDFAS